MGTRGKGWEENQNDTWMAPLLRLLGGGERSDPGLSVFPGSVRKTSSCSASASVSECSGPRRARGLARVHQLRANTVGERICLMKTEPMLGVKLLDMLICLNN